MFRSSGKRKIREEIDADSMNYSINRLLGYYGASKVKPKRKTARSGRLLERNHVAKTRLAEERRPRQF
jgi:hypothetical protein